MSRLSRQAVKQELEDRLRATLEEGGFAERFDLDEFEVNELVGALADEMYDYLGELDTEDLGSEAPLEPDDSPVE